MEISTFDIASSCRTCLRVGDLESLFEVALDSSSMAQILSTLTSMEISLIDKLSKSICLDCRNRLSTAYQFQQMAISNDKRMRTLLEGSQQKYDTDDDIKTEETGNILQDDLVEASIEMPDDSNDVMLAELKPLEDEYESETLNDSHDEEDSETTNSSEDGSEDEDKSKKFCCDACNKSFKSNEKLEHHVRSNHQSGKHSKSAGSDENESTDEDDDPASKIYSCDSCPKKFKKPSLLSRHVKTHDPNRRPHEW